MRAFIPDGVQKRTWLLTTEPYSLSHATLATMLGVNASVIQDWIQGWPEGYIRDVHLPVLLLAQEAAEALRGHGTYSGHIDAALALERSYLTPFDGEATLGWLIARGDTSGVDQLIAMIKSDDSGATVRRSMGLTSEPNAPNEPYVPPTPRRQSVA